MKFTGFIGPSYTLDSVNVDAQRCVNLYPEIIESGTGKGGQRAYLKATPGLKKILEVGDGPIRLVHVDSIGRVFVVSGNQLFTIKRTDGVWSSTLCDTQGEAGTGSAFTFDTDSGLMKAASMSFLGDGTDSSTVFVDGTDNYIFWQFGPTNIAVGKLSSAGFGDVPTATDIVWVDGSFVVNEGGTNKFWVSDLQSFNIDALSFASSEGDPDLVLALAVNHRDLWVFNEKTTEIYSNTGNADFPFERVGGGFLEIGLAAKRSVAKAEGTLLWLGSSAEGRGIIYAARGMTPQRVSTHAIEQAINGYADISTATAYTYQWKGHSFYVLNFAEATWAYDLSTGLWHERAYTNNGDLERYRADTHAFSSLYGVHVLGDYANAKVYIFDDEFYYDDVTTPITRLRAFPHVSTEDLKRVFCSRLQIDMETGIGLPSGQGSDPQVMLDWSNDGGHTWSDESWTSAGGQVGGIGEFKKRVQWRRLGSFRDRVFRIKITDPVPVTLIDAFIDFEVGAA